MIRQMKTFFPTKKDMITPETLLRIFMEYDTNYLSEMLLLMAAWYGEGAILSVFSYDKRELIATNDCKANGKALQKTVLSIDKDISEKCYFLRHEKNGVSFRKGFNCIKIIPLTVRNCSECFLMIEQVSALTPCRNIEAELAVLAIAVKEYVLEQTVKMTGMIDLKSNLPNRDAFLQEYEDMSVNYVVMFTINTHPSKEYILSKLTNVAKKIGDSLVNHFVIVYKISDKSFIYIDHTSKDRYQAIVKAQDVLDKFIEDMPEEDIGVSIVAREDISDIHEALYCLEKMSRQSNKGAVIYIGKPEDMEDDATAEYAEKAVFMGGPVDATFHQEEQEDSFARTSFYRATNEKADGSCGKSKVYETEDAPCSDNMESEYFSFES